MVARRREAGMMCAFERRTAGFDIGGTKMNNKSLVWAGLLAVVSLCGATGIEAADDPVWYVGAGGGRADAKRTSSWGQVADASLLNSGITSSTQVESHETAWKIFGGYQFNQNWAAEAGYTDLGNYRGTSSISAPAVAAAGGNWQAYAVSVAGVGIYPVTDRFAVFGKAGLAGTRLKVNVSGTQYSPSATRAQPLLGVGGRFDVTKVFGVRAEFERFNNVGDGSSTGQTPINVWSLSGQYRF
jgi:OOP family OmpA-OmpF porin